MYSAFTIPDNRSINLCIILLKYFGLFWQVQPSVFIVDLDHEIKQNKSMLTV